MRDILAKANRIVIKTGSALIASKGTPRQAWLDALGGALAVLLGKPVLAGPAKGLGEAKRFMFKQ